MVVALVSRCCAASTSTAVCVPTSKPTSVARNDVVFDSTDWRSARTREISEFTLKYESRVCRSVWRWMRSSASVVARWL